MEQPDVNKMSDADVLMDLINAENEGTIEAMKMDKFEVPDIATEAEEGMRSLNKIAGDAAAAVRELGDELQRMAEKQPGMMRERGVSEKIVKPYEGMVKDNPKSGWRRWFGM